MKRSVLIGAICLMSLLVYGDIGASQTTQPSIRLALEPAMQKIFPFEAEATEEQIPTEFTVQAIGADGQPLENVDVQVQLRTPQTTPWLTTDFPVVENTALLDFKASAPTGEVQFQQMLPIRGVYQMDVSVTPHQGNSVAPFQQTLSVEVSENPVKYQSFAILVAVLLLAGLIGGWVIGQKQHSQPGEIAPQPVRLLLSSAIAVAIAALLYVNISAEMGQSHHTMPLSHLTETPPPAAYPNAIQGSGLNIRLSSDPSAIVGKLANFKVSITDAKTQQPVTDVRVKVRATQLENGWISFTHESAISTAGIFQWQTQFFDGAPHQIDVEVIPQVNSSRQFPPLQVSQTLDVEGVAPPLSVRLTTWAYMTGIVAIGLFLGLCLRRWRPRTVLRFSR